MGPRRLFSIAHEAPKSRPAVGGAKKIGKQRKTRVGSPIASHKKDEREYDISAVIAERFSPNRQGRELKVRWEGYGAADDWWVPAGNVTAGDGSEDDAIANWRRHTGGPQVQVGQTVLLPTKFPSLRTYENQQWIRQTFRLPKMFHVSDAVLTASAGVDGRVRATVVGLWRVASTAPVSCVLAGQCETSKNMFIILPADSISSFPVTAPLAVPAPAAIIPKGGERWQYVPDNKLKALIRTKPSLDASTSGEVLNPGDEFSVSEKRILMTYPYTLEEGMHSVGAHVTWLKLEDGRGWIFETKPFRAGATGCYQLTMCIRVGCKTTTAAAAVEETAQKESAIVVRTLEAGHDQGVRGTGYKWQYSGAGRWRDYDADATAVVEQHYQEKLQGVMDCDVRAVKSGDFHYSVDFDRLTQRNEDHKAHRERCIRRVADAVQDGEPIDNAAAAPRFSPF